MPLFYAMKKTKTITFEDYSRKKRDKYARRGAARNTEDSKQNKPVSGHTVSGHGKTIAESR